MSKIIRYDESLPAFAGLVTKHLGPAIVEAGRVIRDGSGRLSFISRAPLDDAQRETLTAELEAVMGGYVRTGGRSALDVNFPGVGPFLEDPRAVSTRVALGNGEEATVMLLDRRIVGLDWLSPPAPASPDSQPARLVFASMKGGVGRSTALAVLAVDLAMSGYKVLALDLDLEAPGIGSMLLGEDAKPKFGALDYYVECGLSGIDAEFLEDMVAPSPFGGGQGLIDVVPAVGRLADAEPGNVLGKLARAYLEEPSDDGPPIGFLGHTQRLVDQISARQRYDAILIDARAGLNESTAAAVLGLGADVLLFGVDTPQTLAAYRYLLAHLAAFPRTQQDDWLLRLKMVQAKASPEPIEQTSFRDQAYGVFQAILYQDRRVVDAETPGAASTIEEFTVDDETAPHFAWPILSDNNYAVFAPLQDAKLLSDAYYRRTFDRFLTGARERLGLS